MAPRARAGRAYRQATRLVSAGLLVAHRRLQRVAALGAWGNTVARGDGESGQCGGQGVVCGVRVWAGVQPVDGSIHSGEVCPPHGRRRFSPTAAGEQRDRKQQLFRAVCTEWVGREGAWSRGDGGNREMACAMRTSPPMREIAVDDNASSPLSSSGGRRGTRAFDGRRWDDGACFICGRARRWSHIRR